MAITVKHSKVSTIPDGDDSSLVRPSDWNADHTLSGTIPVENGGTGASTANGALTNLLPAQTGNSGKFLSTDGTNTLWSSPTGSGDVVGPASATDNAVARFDATTGKLIQNSVTTIDDTGNASGILSQQFSNGAAVTLAAGKMWYDGTTGAFNAGMGGGNITQQIGEELFVYGKATAAINDSPLQIVYQTGVVGASGVITFAPTVASITDGTLILGVATESLALNAFGRITSYGVVRGITTNGTAFSETWADGDEIYYNPVTGNPTNIKPVAPNVKVSVGTLIKAGAGGSGSIQVEINHGSVLGGTDANVQITSPANGNILSYDGGNGYWKNTDLAAGTGISVSKSANGVLTIDNTSPSSGGTVTSVAATAGTGISITGSPITTSGTLNITNTGVTSAVAGTGISVSGSTGAVTVTNTAPDQTVSLTAGTGISTSGTYPNFTITNTAPSSGGTVTSITAGTGLSGGTITASGTIALANTAVTAGSYTYGNFTVDAQGRLTAASNGTTPVTSVTGTAPVVSSGGTTPAISMPKATGSVDGYLSSTDWTTFNNKGSGTVTSVAASVPSFLSVSGSPITSSGTLAITYSGTALPIANGGTGQTTASAAFNALSPITTTGDLIIGNGTNSATRLAIGTSSYILTSNGTTASWAAPSTIVTISTTAPSSPVAGNLWWNSEEGKLKVYYTDANGSQWVDASTGTVGPAGTNGTNGTNGLGYSGLTSTTSTTIATGSKTFTTNLASTAVAFSVGQRVRLASAANTANFMEGPITSFSSTSLVVNVDYTGGSGTYADWNIGVTGSVGATGATGGAQMYWNTGQSVTSTTMTDLTGLTASIVSGTYAFEVTVGYASSSNTGGRFCMNTTGTLSSINYMQMGQLNNNNLGATTNLTTNGSTSGTAYGTSANAVEFMRMTGYIVATGSGTFSAQALKVTSGTLTIYNGVMTLQKVA